MKALDYLCDQTNTLPQDWTAGESKKTIDGTETKFCHKDDTEVLIVDDCGMFTLEYL